MLLRHHPRWFDKLLAQQLLHTRAGLQLFLARRHGTHAHTQSNPHSTITTTIVANPRPLNGAKVRFELDGPDVATAPQHRQLRLGQFASSQGRPAAARWGMGFVQRQHSTPEGETSVVPTLALLGLLGGVHGRVLTGAVGGRGASLVLVLLLMGLLLLMLLLLLLLPLI